jgi:alpha-1,2-mannosyltransferase
VSTAIRRRAVHVDGLKRTLGRVSTWLLLGAVPPLLLLVVLIGGYRSGTGQWAIDFDGNFLRPAREILHGLSPYHPDQLERVRNAVAAGRRPDEFQDGVFVAYPAPGLLLGVPFTALPLALAQWLWVACMLMAGWLGLRLAGVRDWRVYGAVLLTPALLSSVLLGAVDLALVLGLAAAWRWRDHAGRAGLALGAIIALKLVALPLVAWLLATRRWRAAGTACAVAAALWLAGWALIGFRGFSGYPHLLSLLSDIESTRGYSAVAYAKLAGISGDAAALAPYVLGACLLAAIWIASKRRHRADEAAFMLAVLAVLACSPIVWHHYLVLLFVPLAVYRPRFGPLWLLPLASWVAWHGAFFYPAWGDRLVFLGIVAGIAGWTLARSRAAALGTLPAWQ